MNDIDIDPSGKLLTVDQILCELTDPFLHHLVTGSQGEMLTFVISTNGSLYALHRRFYATTNSSWTGL